MPRPCDALQNPDVAAVTVMYDAALDVQGYVAKLKDDGAGPASFALCDRAVMFC